MLHTTPAAIKTPRLTSNDSRYSYLRELSNELRILRMLHHPNIVMLQGACIDIPAQEIALVLEMVRGEPLNNFITNKQIEPSDLDRYSILVGVSRALCYLHANKPKIVHADLKDSNIIVTNVNGFPIPKLLDFGLSRLLTKHAKPIGGSLEFMAPEVARNRSPPTCAADVFSFGRLAYFVVTGTRPCQGKSRQDLIDMLRDKQLPELIWPVSH